MGRGKHKAEAIDRSFVRYSMDDANRLAAEVERNWYADTSANRICLLCNHKEREKINAMMLRGATWVDIRDFAGLDPTKWNTNARMRKHRDFHLKLKIEQLIRPSLKTARLQLYPRDAHEDKKWWYFCQAYALYSEAVDGGEKPFALQCLKEMRAIDEQHLGLLPQARVLKDAKAIPVESAPPLRSSADMSKVMKALELSRAHKEDYVRTEDIEEA